MKLRHKIIWYSLRPLVVPFLWLKFGYRKKMAKNLPENYIVMSNHTTDFDPLFVGVSFKKPMCFVASEHISRWKHAYKFIHYGFEPILRRKGTVASSTVMDILRKLRGGENVCIFAEGARCWDGISSPILPSTGKMVKSAKCALVTYKIQGGYFLSPNWSEGNTRRGRSIGSVVNVYTAEQIAEMSVDAINEVIRKDLYEDAYERQMADPAKYTGKNLAVKMENLLFICPKCGKLDTISSDGNRVSCSDCDMSFDYNAYAMLEGLPFHTVKELFAWQKNEVQKLADENVVFTAADATLSKIEKHTESVVDVGPVRMDCQMLVCGETEIAVSSISNLAMHGRHALVFSTKDAYYELIISDKKNALKFSLLYEALQPVKL